MKSYGGALDAWFASRGWRPFPFQLQLRSAVAAGESGLLHATTGAGKTFAIWFAALARFADWKAPVTDSAQKPRRARAPALTVLWLTPMRALASDTTAALQTSAQALGLNWTVGMRTGDTTSSVRAAQSKLLPTTLVTTPESLSLLLARADARELFGALEMVVVDEWHELIGNKRGVQVQLALARLRRWRPDLLVWGLSATLGNTDHAMRVLVPGRAGTLVRGRLAKDLVIDTLLPDTVDRFPWAGHLGLAMLPQVAHEVTGSGTTLLFTNTRSQAELWYQALLEAHPEWAGLIALHHGSLDKKVRDWVEAGLKEGRLKAVVCTSSLDLGVDFLPVERVLQIGSAKGVARLLQRAGRSGHAPGRPSRVTLVPTHSLELVEAAAARTAIEAGRIEMRTSPERPLDVLVQHLVTIALGGGFTPDDLFAEVRTAYAYRDLSPGEWAWALAFVRQGGESLRAYPEYRRVEPDDEGVWRVPDKVIARRHRMSIGTIVSDAGMVVKYWGRNGGAIGTVEESFIARLSPGDCFLFGGRLLELVRVQEMTAYVRRTSGKRPAVPRWNGGKMPLSSELADALVQKLEDASNGRFDTPEMRRARPLLDLQMRWSALPTSSVLLAETLKTREGSHLFFYPFAGRHAHLGLASLMAWRVGRQQASTFSMAVNDYGLELLSPVPVDWDAMLNAALFSGERLLDDVLASLNASELARRRFREIARVSGLVFQGYPGQRTSSKHLQASSSLFYEVFKQHDPDNLLLSQATHEVQWQELDMGRLEQTLDRVRSRTLRIVHLERPSPFAFPLMVERFRESLSSEKLRDRLARMVADLETAASAPVPVKKRRSRPPQAPVAKGAKPPHGADAAAVRPDRGRLP